jgi:copper chaperone CopZ
LGLGLKLPLGLHDDSTFVNYSKFINQDDPSNPFIDSVEIWQTAPPTVQATTGTNDLMFYAFYLKNFKKKNFKLVTSALYIHKGWNSLGLKFGDYATVGLFAGTSLFDNRLSLLGQLKGEWVGKMQSHEELDILALYNIEQASTGSAMISVVPQVTYSFKKPQISLFATADIPLYQYMRGTQISSGVQITAGISYRFFAKKPKVEVVDEGFVVYQEERFKVFGICGMCKETIEGTLMGMNGVSVADWDQEAQSLKVRFDSLKLSLDDMKEALAKVGYDSETHKATDAAYNGLHSCCKYERK